MSGAHAALLEGDRLHLNHGPIDLIIDAKGPDRSAAYDAAAAGFEHILPGLVVELDVLTVATSGASVTGPVAKRMMDAVFPLAKDRFVTPMAAVAGAVADEMLQVLSHFDLEKASVNNGGDIAFHLTKGQNFVAASPLGPIHIGADSPARGLATSGWRGRSQSLGIADAVSVLATTAARADAAATLIANAVDLPGHPSVTRVPAHEIEAVPQLNDLLVTVDVGPLTACDRSDALDAGQAYAAKLVESGLILGAALMLQEDVRVVGMSGHAPLTPLPRDVMEPS